MSNTNAIPACVQSNVINKLIASYIEASMCKSNEWCNGFRQACFTLLNAEDYSKFYIGITEHKLVK